MLCRKVSERCIAVHGPCSEQAMQSHLQLALISTVQKIFEEAEGHAHEAFQIAEEIQGHDSLAAASVFHSQALIRWGSVCLCVCVSVCGVMWVVWGCWEGL